MTGLGLRFRTLERQSWAQSSQTDQATYVWLPPQPGDSWAARLETAGPSTADIRSDPLAFSAFSCEVEITRGKAGRFCGGRVRMEGDKGGVARPPVHAVDGRRRT
jgi:hypothetical protein